MFPSPLLFLVALSAQPAERPESSLPERSYPCLNGVTVFFQPGSDRFEDPSYTRQVLEWFLHRSRYWQFTSQLIIEAAGDGGGAHFNRSLSLRRAARLRRWLIANGFERSNIYIVAQQEFGRVPLTVAERERGWSRVAWIQEQVLSHARPIPEGMILECH